MGFVGRGGVRRDVRDAEGASRARLLRAARDYATARLSIHPLRATTPRRMSSRPSIRRPPFADARVPSLDPPLPFPPSRPRPRQALDWEVHPISPVTKDWIAVASPTILLTSLAFYFLVVGLGFATLSSKAASSAKDPSKKDPLWIRSLVIFHNVFLIALSLYMCGGCVLEAYRNGYALWGNAYRAEEKALAHYIYVFYVSKIYEFLDTFIMLLKNNLKQVSFLHVYHHATISFMWWMIAHRAPGGDAYFSAALNSWVHVCMYTYYLVSVLIGKDEKKRKKYLWWGRYLTQMQMFQFFLNLCQSVYTSLYSPYPKFISHILFFYMISLLGLFGHFYYQKHLSGRAKRDEKKTQ